MNAEQILQLLDDERPHFAGYARIVERLPDVTRFRAADGSYPVVVIAGGFDTRDTDAVIARELDWHRAHGYAPFEWTVYGHHAPADMIQRLERHGFTTGPKEAVMSCDLGARPAWMDDGGGAGEAESAAVVVRRIADEQALADFRHVAGTVFNKDYSFTTNELRRALHDGSTEHYGYVAYAGAHGPPAAVGRLYTHPQSRFGGLYGGGTLAEFRGRGFYRATVAARARDAVALGARFLRVDALPTSRPILERLGFVRLTDTWPCEWRP
jgi:hypothetical protein